MSDGDGVKLLMWSTADDLARAVAERLVVLLVDVQAQGRVPAVALTGGTIAEKVHRAVLDSPGRDEVDWDRVDFWFGDERYVPADDPDRNARQAREALLDHLPVDPARVHEMPASDAGFADLTTAATAYGDELRDHGSGLFDLVMLGVGPDGHVASLFPGSPALEVDDTVAVAVSDSPKPPPERISLTFGALNRAREVWFLVSGEQKAAAVARAMAGAPVHEIPAAGVRGQERTLWLLDSAAATELGA